MRDVEQWIRSHAVSFECVCCGGKQWTIQKELAFTLTVEPGRGRINYLGGYLLPCSAYWNSGQSAYDLPGFVLASFFKNSYHRQNLPHVTKKCSSSRHMLLRLNSFLIKCRLMTCRSNPTSKRNRKGTYE